MIMEKVLQAAEPYLAQKTVQDLVIGLSLIGCQLDSGYVGVSYVMREEITRGCSNFPFAQEAIGKPAAEVARWIISSDNSLQRAIASSVLAAASYGQNIPDDNVQGKLFGVDVKPDDTVGMIGHIGPVAKELSKQVKEVIIFDKGADDPGLTPMEKQPELLPTCDIAIISGTTTINGTIDALLKMCSRAREIVMVGPSTPMFPQGWQDSRLTVLAGSWWDNEHKEEIFKLISLAGGIRQLQPYMR
ncbi:MAG: DUF364 domain-containing protein, partial [Firmicutes bacterium]|nr:DUF364 domain-containing protein [Bacillota bacterium]